MSQSRPQPELVYLTTLCLTSRVSVGERTNTNSSEGSRGHVGTHVCEGHKLGALLVSDSWSEEVGRQSLHCDYVVTPFLFFISSALVLEEKTCSHQTERLYNQSEVCGSAH